MTYQSLYRRYRSQTFGQLVGQSHVVTALRNAITEDRVGHAYLFSGPRGTGKTSTARILGKALNCTNLGADGEPCCECESCVGFEAGTSYDLHELDAASNNGVEAIRDLISKVALGSPGRTKVYILDEVHMLTAGAENALLKTLEEPPDHVVFVLATTEPHKVVPTIRSRTQHLEFELIPAAELEAHVRFVAADASLTVDDAMVEYVLRVGGGSARDTLSALDQVVAAGGVPRDDDAINVVMTGLAAADPAQVVSAVSEALKAGRDPRVIGEALLGRLRDAFLTSMSAPLDHLSDTQAAAAADVAQQMGPASITRALEVIGSALIGMRQAPDPRVDLEVALLRLARPDLDTDMAAVVARLERLEQGSVVSNESTPKPRAKGPADMARAALESPKVEPAKAQSKTASGSRPTLGVKRGSATPAETPAPPPVDPVPAEAQAPAQPPASTTPVASAGDVELSDIEQAWEQVRSTLAGRAKSRFSGGRFISSDADQVVFGLPNAIHRDRCQECIPDVEAALAAHFGRPLTLQLVVDDNAVPPTPRAAEPSTQKPVPKAEAEEVVDLDALTDAEGDAASGVDLLTDAFPGAAFVETESE